MTATATKRRGRMKPAAAAPSAGDQLEIAIPPQAHAYRVTYVAHADVHPDPEQPRVAADAELRASIARNGILQPITVRPHPERLDGFMIIDGERRWQGSRGVQDEIPVIIRHDQEEEATRLRTQLVANTGKTLTPLEEARTYAKLLEANGGNQSALAAELGIPRTTLGDRLRLLDLGPWIELLEDGTLPVSHAIQVLVPLRTAPDEVHVKLLEACQKDYRWNGGDVSLSKFEDLVTELIAPSMYPLTALKISGWSAEKNPTFDTRDHATTCTCGGIKWARHSGGRHGTRLHCVNPGYWRTRHRKGLAEQKKTEAAAAPASKPRVKLALPADARTIVMRSQYEVPREVLVLTDKDGGWMPQRLNDYDAAPFDPADLVLMPGALVRVRHPGYDGETIERVGITDALAVSAAQDKWAERWAERREEYAESLGGELYTYSHQFVVDGAGVAKLLPLLARHYGEGMRDLAEAIGLTLPESVADAPSHELGGKMAAWVTGLDEDALGRLATAMATAAGRNLVLTTELVKREQLAALAELRQRPVPWVKLTKAQEAALRKRNESDAREQLAELDEDEDGWDDDDDHDRRLTAADNALHAHEAGDDDDDLPTAPDDDEDDEGASLWDEESTDDEDADAE